MSKGELSKTKKICAVVQSRVSTYPVVYFMKQIKLSGREMAVLRAINFALGSTGTEIQELTQIDGSDLADVLNGLFDVGYVETYPLVEIITSVNYEATRFEVNPSYAQQLKIAMKR